MTTRGTETLAELMSERAGQRGSGLPTWEQISERAIDPRTGYQPSASMLWKVAAQKGAKISPPLVRAIAAGMGLPLLRVQEAAAREYVGWQVDDPWDTPPGDEDVVVRVARTGAQEAADMPATQGFIDQVKKGTPRKGR